MDPVIDQLFKIEQVAQRMESGVEERKEALRQEYKQKRIDFDRDSDLETKELLEQIRKDSKQQQSETNQKMLAQYQAEVERLEHLYNQRQDKIVQSILTKIIKG